MKQINRAVHARVYPGMELVRVGMDPLFWAGKEGSAAEDVLSYYSGSVEAGVYRIGHLSLERWIADARDIWNDAAKEWNRAFPDKKVRFA